MAAFLGGASIQNVDKKVGGRSGMSATRQFPYDGSGETGDREGPPGGSRERRRHGQAPGRTMPPPLGARRGAPEGKKRVEIR